MDQQAVINFASFSGGGLVFVALACQIFLLQAQLDLGCGPNVLPSKLACVHEVYEEYFPLALVVHVSKFA